MEGRSCSKSRVGLLRTVAFLILDIWKKRPPQSCNRILRWIDLGAPGVECIEYEIDPRHRKGLLLQLGFQETASRVVMPFEKIALTLEVELLLSESESGILKSAAMRFTFLALELDCAQHRAIKSAILKDIESIRALSSSYVRTCLALAESRLVIRWASPIDRAVR